ARLRAGVWRALAGAAVMLALSSGAWAQKNKKNQTVDTSTTPLLPMTPTEEIEHAIGEVLGAQQLGNLEVMHKYYSDSATFVNSDYGPPIVGWKNWAEGYERQRAAFQQMQIVRRNTYIFIHADVAWATYQWEFSAMLNTGKEYDARGETTLVFTKVDGNWLIVHNHTAVDCGSLAVAAPAPTTPPAPATPTQAQPQPQN
ncbi:MAG: nuclear transport factor 2 family protein, partial [Candidatus Acidiferrales bacterium]